MTEIDPELEAMIADAAIQLAVDIDSVEAGQAIDLTGLLPRIELLCDVAVVQRAVGSAADLARLIELLDQLSTALSGQIAALGIEDQPDPSRAAAYYRAAVQPGRKD
jgi:hypothetical protein